MNYERWILMYCSKSLESHEQVFTFYEEQEMKEYLYDLQQDDTVSIFAIIPPNSDVKNKYLLSIDNLDLSKSLDLGYEREMIEEYIKPLKKGHEDLPYGSAFETACNYEPDIKKSLKYLYENKELNKMIYKNTYDLYDKEISVASTVSSLMIDYNCSILADIKEQLFNLGYAKTNNL